MAKTKKLQDYKTLKAIWYKKLEKSGFEDIEAEDERLKAWSSQFKRQRSVDSWEAKAAYYSMADSFLNDYKFASRIERIIWEYHANGLSIRGIVETLNKVRKKKTHRTEVWLTVNRLETAMKNMYMNYGPLNE